MILDLPTVARFGVPPETTDKTDGMDVDLIAATPELIDENRYPPSAMPITRR